MFFSGNSPRQWVQAVRFGHHRRRARRLELNMPIQVFKHHQTQPQDTVALDLSTGGLRIGPVIQGYVGEHVFVSAGNFIDRAEARIVNQDAGGMGLRFVFPLPEPKVEQIALVEKRSTR